MDDSQKEDDLIGRPVAHMTAFQRATGEAQFVDDIAPRRGKFFASVC